MALTRAQYVAGNTADGVVLSGQPQGVRQGSGITIASDGVISVNGNDPSFNELVKTNNVNAFNDYIWPTTIPASGTTFLTVDPAGALGWFAQGTSGQYLQTLGGTITWANAVNSLTAGTNITTNGTTGNITINSLQGPEIILAVGGTGPTRTINIQQSTGYFVTATLNANCTFTFTTPESGAVFFTLFLTNDATAGRSITWPATVSWSNGNTVPVRTTAANATDVYTFFTTNQGGTWYGNLGIRNYV